MSFTQVATLASNLSAKQAYDRIQVGGLGVPMVVGAQLQIGSQILILRKPASVNDAVLYVNPFIANAVYLSGMAILDATVPTISSNVTGLEGNPFLYPSSPSWNLAWLFALANLATKHGTMGIFGASMGMGGSNVSDCASKSIFEQLRDMKLAIAGAQLYGDFWSVYYSVQGSGQGAGGWQFSPTTHWPNGAPFVFDNAGTGWAPRGMFLGMNGLGTSGSPIFHIVTPSSRTVNAAGSTIYAAIIDLIIFDATGANGLTITLNVDGSAPSAGQMTLDGSTTGISGGQFTLGGTNTLRRLRITGVSGSNFSPTTQHTVNITAQSNANAASTIIGLCTYPANNGSGAPVEGGYAFARYCGGGGTYLHEMARQDAGAPFPVDKIALFQGGATQSTQFGFPFDCIAPILDIYDDCAAYSGNPAAQGGSVPVYTSYGLSPIGYEDAVRRLLGAMRAGRLNATGGAYGISPIVVKTSFPDPGVGDVGAGGIPGGWREYFEREWALCQGEFGGCLYDANSDFAEYGATNGWQTSGNPHVTNLGAARQASQLNLVT